MSAYPKHDAAIGYARHCVGVHEDPMGSNRGPLQVWAPVGGVSYFESFDWVAGDGYPWCVDLAQAAWHHAGHPLPWGTAGAYDLENRARGVGWVRPLYNLVPGDLIILHEGSGHCCLFESSSGGYVHSVDGNWGDKVQRVMHPADQCVGIHIPENHVVPPAKPPLWVVATSISGKRVVLLTRRCTESRLFKLLPPFLKRYGAAGVTITRGK